MVQITEDLLRKRAEHNDKDITTLEEISLHQENITKIENIDRWCKQLRILLLQSNLISKIENLGRLKLLEYLNLALNNIEVVENLQDCEMLQKLDLTLNFIGDIESIVSLQANHHLESLFLTGNPCSDYPGYREFVVATLPQLKYFDGKEILRSERIIALQNVTNISKNLPSYQRAYQDKRDKQKQEAALNFLPEDKETGGIDPEENSRFWNKMSENTPEARIEMAERTRRAQRTAEQSKESQPRKRVLRFFKEDGTPFNINEAKMQFKLESDEETNSLVLTVETFKYMATSLIDVDVQPRYVRLTIKGKILQLALSEEVRTDNATARRSQTTGYLTITMPKVSGEIKGKKDLPQPKARKAEGAEVPNPSFSRRELLEIGRRDPVDYCNIVQNNVKSLEENMKKSRFALKTNKGENKQKPSQTDFVDDPDVPPLE